MDAIRWMVCLFVPYKKSRLIITTNNIIKLDPNIQTRNRLSKHAMNKIHKRWAGISVPCSVCHIDISNSETSYYAWNYTNLLPHSTFHISLIESFNVNPREQPIEIWIEPLFDCGLNVRIHFIREFTIVKLL